MTDNKTEIFDENAVLVGLITMSQNEKKAKEYPAMQFDMEIAEGADIADIKVSMPTDHSVAYRRIDDTTVRVGGMRCFKPSKNRFLRKVRKLLV